MKRYNIVLISIISLAILSVVVYAAAQLSVTPSTVNAGTPITIQVTPTSYGVYKYAYVYRDNTYKAAVTFPCSNYKCYRTTQTSFTIPLNWVNSDKYNVRVYDYSISNYVRAYFTVTGGAEPRNTAVTLNPTAVNAGEVLNINVVPGNDGVNRYAYIYDSSSNRKATIDFGCISPCLNNIAVSYTIPSTFASGTYYLWVYDYGIKNYIKTQFNVVGASSSSCSDTDGGFNIYTQGTMTVVSGNVTYINTDYCMNSTSVLVEYSCGGSELVHFDLFDCSSINSTKSCVSGACV